MLRLLLLLLVVFFGFTGIAVFGYYSLIDWNALQQAYANFAELAKSSTSLTTIFAAEAQQNIHRLNLFAESVWTLQSAIITAIGIHGICTFSSRKKTNR